MTQQAISLVRPAGRGRSDLRAVAHRLPRRFAGPVHLPGDPGYDVERRSLSAPIDPRPGAAIEALVAEHEPVSTVEIRHWGGAMARPARSGTPQHPTRLRSARVEGQIRYPAAITCLAFH